MSIQARGQAKCPANVVQLKTTWPKCFASDAALNTTESLYTAKYQQMECSKIKSLACCQIKASKSLSRTWKKMVQLWLRTSMMAPLQLLEKQQPTTKNQRLGWRKISELKNNILLLKICETSTLSYFPHLQVFSQIKHGEYDQFWLRILPQL